MAGGSNRLPMPWRRRRRDIYIYIQVNLSSTAFSTCEDAYSNVAFVLSANFGSRESGEDRRFSSLDVVAVALVGLTTVFCPHNTPKPQPIQAMKQVVKTLRMKPQQQHYRPEILSPAEHLNPEP